MKKVAFLIFSVLILLVSIPVYGSRRTVLIEGFQNTG
jgi:hypothetical protein